MVGSHEVENSSLGACMLNSDDGNQIKERLAWAERAYAHSLDAEVWCHDSLGLRVVAQKASSADGSDIFFIAFRGTDNEENIISDLNAQMVPLHEALRFPTEFGARIHSGFQSAYLSLRAKMWSWLDAQGHHDQLPTFTALGDSSLAQGTNFATVVDSSVVPPAEQRSFRLFSVPFSCRHRRSSDVHQLPAASQRRRLCEVHDFLNVRQPETSKVAKVTGHSLGGALATVAALDLKNAGFEVELVTFGCPRVGNTGFRSLCEEKLTHSCMALFVNTYDPVPRLPLESQGFVHICGTTCLDSFFTSGTEVMGKLLQIIAVPIKQKDVWSNAFVCLTAEHKLQAYKDKVQHYHDSFLAQLLKTGMRITPGANALVARAVLATSIAAVGGPAAVALQATCTYLANMNQELLDGLNSVSQQLDAMHNSVLNAIACAVDRVIHHAIKTEILEIRALCTCLHDNTAWAVGSDMIVAQTMKLQEKLEMLRLRLVSQGQCEACPKAPVLDLLLRAHALELFALSSIVVSKGQASDDASKMLANRPKVLIQRLSPMLGEFLWDNVQKPGESEKKLPARNALLNTMVALLGSRDAFSLEVGSMVDFRQLFDNPDSGKERCRIALLRLPLEDNQPALGWFRQAARQQARTTESDKDWAKFALGANSWKLADFKGALQQWSQVSNLSEKMDDLFPEASVSLCRGGVILFPHPCYASLQEAIRAGLEQATDDNTATVMLHDSVAESTAISINHGRLTIQVFQNLNSRKTSISCPCFRVQSRASLSVKDVTLRLQSLVVQDCQKLVLESCQLQCTDVGIEAGGNSKVELNNGTCVSGSAYGLRAKDCATVTLGRCRIIAARNRTAVKASQRTRIVLQSDAVRNCLGESFDLQDDAVFELRGQRWKPRSSLCPCGSRSEFNALEV